MFSPLVHQLLPASQKQPVIYRLTAAVSDRGLSGQIRFLAPVYMVYNFEYFLIMFAFCLSADLITLIITVVKTGTQTLEGLHGGVFYEVCFVHAAEYTRICVLKMIYFFAFLIALMLYNLHVTLLTQT